MDALNRTASKQGRQDEGPNVALARELAETENVAGIREIAAHLWDRDAAVRGDCVKVLYEIGERKPQLIAPYTDDFLHLLTDKQIRMAWGGMTALATIATIAADALYPHTDEIRAAMGRGSVIAVDNGVKTLARIAATSPERNAAIFPLLLAHLEQCRAKAMPQHAEQIAVAVTADNRAAFTAVLERRLPELSASQATRIRKLLEKPAPGKLTLADLYGSVPALPGETADLEQEIDEAMQAMAHRRVGRSDPETMRRAEVAGRGRAGPR